MGVPGRWRVYYRPKSLHAAQGEQRLHNRGVRQRGGVAEAVLFPVHTPGTQLMRALSSESFTVYEG